MNAELTSRIKRADILAVLKSSKEAPIIVFIHPSGPMMGRRFTLIKDQYLLGRAPNAEILVDSPSVSREHARITRSERGWEIVDLGSTNGVLVNSLPKTRTHLKDRDIVTLGDTSFKYLEGENVEAAYHKEVYRITILDELTQIHNRRYFFDCLSREIAIAKRHKSPLSLIIMDLDHFKDVNDDHGHIVGDKVLRGVTDRIRPKIRREDIFARYGGEEFVIMLPRTDKPGALSFAGKVKDLIASTPFAISNLRIHLTASLGVTTYPGKRKIDAQALVNAADKKLYQAKKLGRNCVVG